MNDEEAPLHKALLFEIEQILKPLCSASGLSAVIKLIKQYGDLRDGIAFKHGKEQVRRECHEKIVRLRGEIFARSTAPLTREEVLSLYSQEEINASGHAKLRHDETDKLFTLYTLAHKYVPCFMCGEPLSPKYKRTLYDGEVDNDTHTSSDTECYRMTSDGGSPSDWNFAFEDAWVRVELDFFRPVTHDLRGPTAKGLLKALFPKR